MQKFKYHESISSRIINKLLNKLNHSKTEFMLNLNNTFLEDEQNAVPEDKVSVAKYQLKIQHLNELNKKLYIENSQLRAKIVSLEHQNIDILNNHIDQNSVIQSLRKQLQSEKDRNFQLSKKNDQLLGTILLNEQLSVEARMESKCYVTRYEQKVLELRQSLQMKQLQVQNLQQKYQKFRSLQLPTNIKNCNRFTSEILKYEALIERLIQQKNYHPTQNVNQINQVLLQLTPQDQTTKKIKKDKSAKTSTVTDVRPNLATLYNQSPYGPLDQEKFDIIFLKLHLELRSLKQNYREKIEQIAELKSKDKIMKQGYNTLTKEMQKVKNLNCQLAIQLEHANKKLQTTKELQIRSVGNIQNKKALQKQNAESKISSDPSIQHNCSILKNKTKGQLPSETKYDTLEVSKSHNFDERIENIEGILSLDSDPDFRDLNNRREMRKDQNEDELSVCEQNSVDMSISLDASGFLPSHVGHHEISEHILTGLIDKKVL